MVQEKRIVDQVSGWLTLYDDASVDRTWTGPPEVKFMSDAVPPHRNFIDGVATADTATADGLKLRIYLPEKQENDPEKLPILLHFHGGGFCISEADWFMYYAVYTRLARDARAIVVSVYLRRAPEHRLPAACDDGFAALLWLRSAAEACGWLHDHADFGRVFLIGDSSGGNIVHQVAARAGDEGDHPITPPPPHIVPTPPHHPINPPPPHPVTPPPPPHIVPTPPPHPITPPPPHIAPTPPHPPPGPHPITPPPPQPHPIPPHHHTVIIIVFISVGGLFFLAFLAAALFCCVKKRKKKIVQETDKFKIDEHVNVQEAIVAGPNGTQTVVLTIDEDVHVEEEIKRNEVETQRFQYLKSDQTASEIVGSTSTANHHHNHQ